MSDLSLTSTEIRWRRGDVGGAGLPDLMVVMASTRWFLGWERTAACSEKLNRRTRASLLVTAVCSKIGLGFAVHHCSNDGDSNVQLFVFGHSKIRFLLSSRLEFWVKVVGTVHLRFDFGGFSMNKRCVPRVFF